MFMLAAVVFYAAGLTLINPLACVLYRGTSIVQQPVDLTDLTQRITRDAQAFIRSSTTGTSTTPFFLFLSYIKVHTALFTADAFAGVSQAGAFGDNVEELDWSVGEVLRTLEEQGATNNTLVWFTSDNGPYLEKGVEGGSSGGLRGGKGQNWEGGIRVPGMLSWPGHVTPGVVSSQAVSTMDILPTSLAVIDEHLGRAPFTGSRVMDGQDIRGVVPGLAQTETAGVSPHEYMFHYCGDMVHAVRVRSRYKVHFFTAIAEPDAEANGGTKGSCPGQSICGCKGEFVQSHFPPLVFDLQNDVSETTPVQMPVEFLEEVALAVQRHSASLEQNVPNQLESIARPWLFPCCGGIFNPLGPCRCNHDTGHTPVY
jgi:steryl-sulfatase